jgi:hypothetical protein
MKSVSLGIFVAAAWLLAPLTVSAAGPFDGVWTGQSVTTYGRCPHRYQLDLTIRDGKLRGRMVSNYERMTIDTSVDEDGRLGAIFAYNGRTLVKTADGGLGATEGRVEWRSQEPDYFEIEDIGDCAGVVTLRKVSDGEQQSALPPQKAAR